MVQFLELMETLVPHRKNLVLILLKQTQNFAWVYIIILIIVVCLLKFKTDNRNVNFPTQFCLGSISHRFSATESTEVSLNANVNDFSVDCNSVKNLKH